MNSNSYNWHSCVNNARCINLFRAVVCHQAVSGLSLPGPQTLSGIYDPPAVHGKLRTDWNSNIEITHLHGDVILQLQKVSLKHVTGIAVHKFLTFKQPQKAMLLFRDGRE